MIELRERLGFRLPLHAEALTAALAAHATPGLERQEPDGTHVRALAAPGGPAVVRFTVEPDAVAATLTLTDEADRDWTIAALRRWLDLDADPEAIDAVLAADARLAPLVAARPGVRALGCLDPFETAVLAVLGQQVSVKAARTFGARLIAAYGEPLGDGLARFPTPAVLAGADPADLQSRVGITHGRVRTVLALSATSSLHGVEATEANPTLRSELLAIPGIGPWTVDYLALRLGDRDAYPAGDLVLQRALDVHSAPAAEEAAEGWRPYRAYGLFSLWTDAVFLV